MIDQIREYVNLVARHLTLRGVARTQALADLDALLREQAALTSPAEAIAALGDPADYATNLNAQLGDEHRWDTLFGMPNALRTGFARRLAGTFDPSNQQFLVPRVIGLGWSLNLGAVAVRLGLLHPDDVDDEVIAQALNHQQIARAIAMLPAAMTLLRLGRSRRTPASLPNAIGAGSSAVLALAAVAMAGDDELEPDVRLVLPAAATWIGGIAWAATLPSSKARRGSCNLRGLPVVLLVGPLALAVVVQPVRAAIDDFIAAKTTRGQ